MVTALITTPATYRRRVVDQELDDLMTGLPAIAVEGAKAVGKTATAAQRAETAYPLDDPDQQAIAAADLDRLLAAPNPVLIEEWQNVPRCGTGFGGRSTAARRRAASFSPARHRPGRPAPIRAAGAS